MINFTINSIIISVCIFLLAIAELYVKYENSDEQICDLIYTLMGRESKLPNGAACIVFLIPVLNVIISIIVFMIMTSSEFCEKFTEAVKNDNRDN